MAYYIGIEIEDTKIRLIEMKRRWKTYTVTNKVEIPLSSQVFYEGLIVDESRVYEVIKEVLKSYKLQGRRAYVLLDPNLVMRWEVKVPCCLEKEIERFLEIHEKDYLPVSLKDYAINCQRLEGKVNHHQELGHFMVVGARYNYLNGVIKLLENMKFTPMLMTSIVDLLPYYNRHVASLTSYGVLYENDTSFIIALYENNLCTVSRVFDKGTLMTLWNIEEKVQNGWYEILGWEIHKLMAFYNEAQPNGQINHLFTYWQEDLDEVDAYFRDLLGIDVTFSRRVNPDHKLLREEHSYESLIHLVKTATEGA